MSTPCMIFMDTESGPKGVYCHYDGMLENTGLTLYHHYNDEEKVKELIVKAGVSIPSNATKSILVDIAKIHGLL